MTCKIEVKIFILKKIHEKRVVLIVIVNSKFKCHSAKDSELIS